MLQLYLWFLPVIFTPKSSPFIRSQFDKLEWLPEECEVMKKSRFTEEKIAYILRQVESGKSAVDVCREHGVSEQTFYRWKKKYGGMGVAELRRLRQLEEENIKLKQLVADLSLDKHMLQEVISKKL
jgi:putative transposase